MNPSIDNILSRFPKTRPLLDSRYAEIYEEHYTENRSGGSVGSKLSQWAESWLHKRVAEDVVGLCSPEATLEIGAGTLNQLKYEPFNSHYDVIEPYDAFVNISEEPLDKVNTLYKSIEEVPVTSKYSRITSIAAFEHILDLPKVIAKSTMLLEENGQMRVSIPAEGTILWKLGWMCTTGLEFRLRRKLDYSRLLEYEHVNTAIEIEEILRYFFGSVEIKVLGLSRGLSIYQFFGCRNPNLKRSEDYLRS